MAKRKRERRINSPRKTHRSPAGALPGIITSPPGATPSSIRLLAFDEHTLIEHKICSLDTVRAEAAKSLTIWVDIVGLGSTDLIEGIGQLFNLHPLALEDSMHTHQRPKVEEYPTGHYIAIRAPQDGHESNLGLEQISLFFGPKYVVTIQEDQRDCFEPVRERIRQARGRVRRLGSDYLVYTLLDAAVDSYFPLVEAYGDRLEELEDRILEGSDRALIGELHSTRRDLLSMRRAVWPLREAVNVLVREEHPNITDDTRLYLRDVYDHTIQLVELIEAHREIATGLLDTYLSSVNNRMSEVMKVLTIISTIFIPLSFVAGVYGMNFEAGASPWNMPELRWRYGYLFALAIMAAIAFGLLLWFRRKRWI